MALRVTGAWLQVEKGMAEEFGQRLREVLFVLPFGEDFLCGSALLQMQQALLPSSALLPCKNTHRDKALAMLPVHAQWLSLCQKCFYIYAKGGQ